VRALEADAGRTIGLAWCGIDPWAPSFRAFAQFLRATAPAGTRAVESDG
jgi:hypothetical protein